MRSSVIRRFFDLGFESNVNTTVASKINNGTLIVQLKPEKGKHQTMANKLTPGTDEYLQWALDSSYSFDEIITDPQQADNEAKKRVQQAIEKHSTKVNLFGLQITHIPKNICELNTLEVLIIFRPEVNKQPFTLPTGKVLDKMAALKVLILYVCNISETAFLMPLKNLIYLDLSRNKITTTHNLAALSQLSTLNLSCNQITTIENLQDLSQLNTLDLSYNQITTTHNLAALSQLTTLRLSHNQITTIENLQDLSQLTTLLLSFNQITTIENLQDLSQLNTLDLSYNQITTTHNLQALSHLNTLNLSSNQITTIGNLEALSQLTTLNLSANPITTIESLQQLTKLKSIDLSDLKLTSFNLNDIKSPDFNKLICENTSIANIPTAILSKNINDNCLPRIKDYFLALENGAVPINEVTLMVLGNGQIGKTQICRRLCGEHFDKNVPSTHGVLIKQAKLPVVNNSTPPIILNIWDFGGQELYHGTHRLFFNSHNTVFLVMWLPSAENDQSHTVDGMTFKNHTLDYWLEHIRQSSGDSSRLSAKGEARVIVAQAQCDKTPYQNTLKVNHWDRGFASARMTDTSALDDDGLDRLIPLLQQAAKQTLNHSKQQLMPKAWQRVKQQIEQWKIADNSAPKDKKQYRFINQQQFAELCQNHDDPALTIPNNATSTLLHLLHQTGVVYYKKGLFNNNILIDQTWCLDAIYGVFHRQTAYTKLKQRNGIFEADDMGYWLWNQQGHSVQEQALFIEMMESCGVCFRLSEHYYWQNNEYQQVQYCVPELLPDKSHPTIEGAIQSHWLTNPMTEQQITYTADLLHQTLFNRIMAMIARQANRGGYYWNNGLLVYASQFNSWLLFNRDMQTPWQGKLYFKAKGQNTNGLLQHLIKWIEDEHQSWNVQLTLANDDASVKSNHIVTGHIKTSQQAHETTSEKLVPPITMSQSKPEIYISYRWKNEDVAIVDEFCQFAASKGIEVLRDTGQLNLGDNIKKFMRRIGRGKQVIVVLSNSYLQSPNCMYELFEIWRNSKSEAEGFLSRIKVFRMADLHIDRPQQRMKIAAYWKAQYQELDEAIDQYGKDVIGEADFREFKRIGQFYLNIGDMLKVISDTLNPQSIEQLKEYGLKDLDLTPQ